MVFNQGYILWAVRFRFELLHLEVEPDGIGYQAAHRFADKVDDVRVVEATSTVVLYLCIKHAWEWFDETPLARGGGCDQGG